MAGVTPRQIYQALISAGASTTQAIGIMANGIAESGLNPEEVGDQGTSFGIWQEHGLGYAGLVTNNPPVDMRAQVGILAQNGGITAARGSTPAAAAGSFSASYERCIGCQPGQPSYNARVSNAATVAGWVSSGKWPTAASGSSGGASGAAAGSGVTSACLVGIHGPSIPVLGSVNICFVSRSQARAILGGGLLAGSAVAGLVGLLILAAAGFRMSGAGRAAGSALEGTGAVLAFVPGAEAAGLAVGAAGATARRAGEPGAGRKSLDRRRAARTEAAKAAAKEKTATERKQAQAERAAKPKPAAKREVTASDRAQLRARADQISTRREAAA